MEPSQDEKRLFFTTSDLLETMNRTIDEMAPDDDPSKPKFELQRRLPDGTTRKVDKQELAAADMESKFQQAAKQVELMSPEEKLKWAEQQRLEGNRLYGKGDYRAALDVYLTCLVAKPPSDATKQSHADFCAMLFSPVMNNLAQCTLQLSMYRKTEEFCTMALEEIDDKSDGHEIFDRKLVSKLYFRRGKSRRLRGLYRTARDDLERGNSLLSAEDSSEKRAVERELNLIERAETEAERNRKRQERAMKKALGGDTSEPNGRDDKGRKQSGSARASDDSFAALYSTAHQKRKYSTLRARRHVEVHDESDNLEQQPTYWQWYLSAMGRVAEKLLLMIGDAKDADDKRKDGDDDLRREKLD